MKNFIYHGLLLACFSASSLFAQAAISATETGNNSTSSAVAGASTPSVAVIPAWRHTLDRWLQINEFDFATRYRSVTDQNNAHEYNQGQQRSVIDGTFKIDPEGKYGVAFHLSSGRYFNWSYADFAGGGAAEAYPAEIAKFTPIQNVVTRPTLLGPFGKSFLAGAGSSGGWALLPRRLYGFAEPIQGVQIQYGSLDINRGAGSEITSYDNDGYIAGERLLIKKPETFFFDEASITFGYLGDLYTANFFNRGERLTQSNYHQFLLGKKYGKRLSASVDYTWQDDAYTMREAAAVKVREARVIDFLRFEAYQRPNKGPFRGTRIALAGGNGFAVTIDKKIDRLHLEGGVANIDPRYVILAQQPVASLLGLAVNGDVYGVGNRFFVKTAIDITPYLQTVGFYTHQYGTIPDPVQLIWNKQALNAGISLDIKKLLFPSAEPK